VAGSVTNTDIVRASFEAFRAQDAAAAERLMADDFVFTSPQDDRIDRAACPESIAADQLIAPYHR
jgi:ketosteroid isomerase-like protein